MAWVNWGRKSAEKAVEPGAMGIDLNSSRARGALTKVARNKLVLLDEPHIDLPLTISLDGRSPVCGREVSKVCRKVPHAICSGYLAALNQPNEWKNGRQTLNAEQALTIAFDRLRTITGGQHPLGFGLPSYLTPAQVAKLLTVAERSRVKVQGTVSLPLALATDRATHYLTQGLESVDPRKSGQFLTPTNILIVDVDDHALTATMVRISETEVRQLSSSTFPRLGERIWKERLMDTLSDRCVRLCRRDPRDNSETEQLLYDQLDDSLERARAGQRVSINIRSTHWYQDLELSPADFDGFCMPLTKLAVEEVRQILANIKDTEMPRVAWLTYDAGRIPGLANQLHLNLTERTAVRVLHQEAGAAAAANMIERWQVGSLPRIHLDTIVKLPPRAEGKPKSVPVTAPAPSPAQGTNVPTTRKG